MWVAGIDYSTRAVDVVLVHLDDLEPPAWARFAFGGTDAFERAREVWFPPSSYWDDITAVGIEDPRGYNTGALYRIQGAILAHIPRSLLVQPWVPSEWRKAVGLPGNASKQEVREMVQWTAMGAWWQDWPQDAFDAYCLARATRHAITRENAA